MKKYFFIAGLFFFAFLNNAFAAVNYYWYTGTTYATGQYGSPSEACNTLSQGRWAVSSQNGYRLDSPELTYVAETRYTCRVKIWSTYNNAYQSIGAANISRSGDSCPATQVLLADQSGGSCGCPAGKIKDTMSGQCVNPPSECKAKLGQTHSIWTDSPRMEMCISGCSVAVVNMIPVKRLVDEGVSYDVETQYTGDDCEGDDTPTKCTDNCTLSKPTESTTETECGATTTDAEGRQQSNCQTTETMKDTQACASNGGSVGQVNGSLTCVANNKGPKATESTKDVKQTTQTNPDGSTKTTTETTTTVKNCVGTKACTTTSTTVTNINNTNADGTPGGSSSSCEGINCGAGGKPSETPGESEETEEEGIPGPTKSLGPKDSSGFGDTGKEWDDKIAAGREQLDGLIDQYSNLFSGAFDLNIGTGGGALPCYKIPVNALKINTTLDFCPANFEDQLIYLKYILLACATILAGFFILRD